EARRVEVAGAYWLSLELRRRGLTCDGRALEDTRDPRLDLCRDLLPAVRHHHQVRTPVELDVVGLAIRFLVFLELLLRERGRNGVVLLRPDDEQRSPLTALEVNFGRRGEMEVREAGLVEDLTGLRHGVALVRIGCCLWTERVHEAEGELLERQWDDAVPPRWMRECGRRRLERRERQHEDALRGRGAHRDS